MLRGQGPHIQPACVRPKAHFLNCSDVQPNAVSVTRRTGIDAPVQRGRLRGREERYQGDSEWNAVKGVTILREAE